MDQDLTTLLQNYKPSKESLELVRSTTVLLLVGPTGAGKDSLKDRLLETNKYHHIVSHTTRQPRINHGVLETDGYEYHFIDVAKAEKMMLKKQFIEVKMYSGNLYGTSVSEIELAKNEGKIAMTDIEVQGVAEYKEIDPNVIAIFLLPPDFEVWQERLTRRYGDVVDVTDHRLRLNTALTELDRLLHTDLYIPVINDDLDQTFETVNSIATGTNKSSYDEHKARDVATQLEKDIKDYLKNN